VKGALEKEKILSLTKKPPIPLRRYHEKLQFDNASPLPKRRTRFISDKEICTLEAPGIADNYYTSVIDWGASNVIGVALKEELYVWREKTNGARKPKLLTTLANEEPITSVLVGEPNCVIIGSENGHLDVWDIERGLQLRSLLGHTNRIATLDQHHHVLSSGSRDSRIIHWDLRTREAKICVIDSQHQHEVCAIKWNADGSVLASGGVDEALCLWSMSTRSLEAKIESAHSSTIKALAWCPWQSNILASGAGIGDKCIKFWQSYTHSLLDSVETCAQISALQWCAPTRELISAHGYSTNTITVWRYPQMKPIARLSGHTSRVLGMAMSPDQRIIVSASADETLKYWCIRPDISSSLSSHSRHHHHFLYERPSTPRHTNRLVSMLYATSTRKKWILTPE
jgi:cell division cycle protein 20 (cofactor of APC complex)